MNLKLSYRISRVKIRNAEHAVKSLYCIIRIKYGYYTIYDYATREAPGMVASATGLKSDSKYAFCFCESTSGARWAITSSSKVICKLAGGCAFAITISFFASEGTYSATSLRIVTLELRLNSSYATKIYKTPSTGFLYKNKYRVMQNSTKMPKGESTTPAISTGVFIGKTTYKTKITASTISTGVIILNKFPKFICGDMS